VYLFINNENIMAKEKGSVGTSKKRETKKVTRKGVHAKTKTSSTKTSKNYKKLSRGQG
jgi:hypothetical protein